MDPPGKVALITGAAGGLGGAFSRALLAAGAKLVLCDVDDGAGKKALEELQKQYGRENVIFVKADVTNSDSLEEVFKTAKPTFQRLDIVVNNAGIMRDSMWEKEIDINIKGVVSTMLLAFKYMGKHEGGEGGVVVNLSSMLGLKAVPQLPIYSGTKHAVNAITRSYGDKLHVDKTGVSVMALCPGPSDTPMLHEANQFVLHEYLQESLAGFITMYPVNKPEFIAEALMRVIREGQSGSVWIADNGEIRPAVYPRLLQ